MEASNKLRVDVKIMNYFDFYLLIDYKSQQKISKSINRVLLICHVYERYSR